MCCAEIGDRGRDGGHLHVVYSEAAWSGTVGCSVTCVPGQCCHRGWRQEQEQSRNQPHINSGMYPYHLSQQAGISRSGA